MKIVKILIAGTLIAGFVSSWGMGQSNDIPVELKARVEKGADLMRAGAYREADEEFKYVLDHAKVIPAELCYFFGANSYHLGSLKQSINWLSKYLELKGTIGQYSEECESMLNDAKAKYQLYQQANSNLTPADTAGSQVWNTEIDCGPSGKIVCPVCKGNGVIIKETLFGKEYSTCPYSDKYGYMSCEDYNLLLQGKLDPDPVN